MKKLLAEGHRLRQLYDLAKAKKQPLHSLSHRKAGVFIKVREEGKPTDWVRAHQVDGKWEPVPEEGKPKRRRKASKPPALPPSRPETLQWRGEHAGRKKGDITKIGSRWYVVTAAKPAKSKRLTGLDEDMGHGMAGDRVTYQDVQIRDALPDEIAAEEERRAKVKAAAHAATPQGHLEAWREAHPEAESFPEHMTPPGVVWGDPVRQGSETFMTGTGPDGSQWAQLAMSTYDDHRVAYYRTAPDPEAARAVEAKRQAARAALDRIAETGTYTDADVAHIDAGLRQELFNNRWVLAGPGRLDLGPDGRPVLTPDGRRMEVLEHVVAAHRAFGPMEGPRDLGFETAHKDAYFRAGLRIASHLTQEAVDNLRTATPPPAYADRIADRIAKAETDIAELSAAEEAQRQAEEAAEEEKRRARQAARASRGSSRASRGSSPSASFTKLRDGSWGIRVEGDADAGDSVAVRRKDGSSETKRLGRLVHDGGSYKLFKMTKAEQARFVVDLVRAR